MNIFIQRIQVGHMQCDFPVYWIYLLKVFKTVPAFFPSFNFDICYFAATRTERLDMNISKALNLNLKKKYRTLKLKSFNQRVRHILFSLTFDNRNGVMVSVLSSSSINNEFESRSGQAKDCRIDIYCSFDK